MAPCPAWHCVPPCHSAPARHHSPVSLCPCGSPLLTCHPVPLSLCPYLMPCLNTHPPSYVSPLPVAAAWSCGRFGAGGCRGEQGYSALEPLRPGNAGPVPQAELGSTGVPARWHGDLGGTWDTGAAAGTERSGLCRLRGSRGHRCPECPWGEVASLPAGTPLDTHVGYGAARPRSAAWCRVNPSPAVPCPRPPALGLGQPRLQQ